MEFQLVASLLWIKAKSPTPKQAWENGVPCNHSLNIAHRMWQPHGTNALLEAQGVPVKTVRDVRRRVTEDLFHRAFSSRLLRLTLQGPLEGASWKEMQGGLKHHCSCFWKHIIHLSSFVDQPTAITRAADYEDVIGPHKMLNLHAMVGPRNLCSCTT